MDSEFRFHLQSLVDEYMSQGLDRQAAETRAAREFGAVALAKDECRDATGVSLFHDFGQDVRYALRSARRNLAFTAVAVLTLAMGIGANTALFSVVNAVLLRPLPFPEADRLVSIWENVPASETPLGRPLRLGLPAPDLREVRRASRTLSNVEGYGTLVELRLGREEDAEISGARVAADTLSTLGARTQLGRVFNQHESTSMEPVLVLSGAVWRRHFASDPAVIGRVVPAEGVFPPPYGLPRQLYTVVGVMVDDFRFPREDTGFWVPLNIDRAGSSANIARLRPGVSRATAEEEINAMLRPRRQSATTLKSTIEETRRFNVVGLQDELVASVRPVLRVLVVAGALVLLIVCGNVANLLLARATVRGREISVRMALGAGRARVLRQMMTEGTVLAVFGGVAGGILAIGGVYALRTLFQDLRGHTNILQVGADGSRVATFPRMEEIGIDAYTLAFTAGICLLTGVFFGLAPALRTAASSFVTALRDGSASAVSGFGLFRRNATRSVLVISQVALAVTLLVGGGLVVRSFLKLVTTDAGFSSSNVLTFQLRLSKGYTNRQVRQVSDQLVERVSSLPDVRGAAYGMLPLVSRRQSTVFLTSPSEQSQTQGGGDSFTPQTPELRLVSQDYLRVMGMRIVTGRGFEETPSGGGRALIVNETLAKSRFPGQNPVGREVYLEGAAGEAWRINGVVADVHQQGLDVEPAPQVFINFAQWDRFMDIADDPGYYAIRTGSPPSSTLITSLRNIVRQLDGQAMLDNVATMEELMDSSLARPRMYAVLLGMFAVLAVTIAGVGVYGVMAYAVAQNTREIGLRMALGARANEVLRLVVGKAAVLTGIGLLLGFGGALAVGQYLQSMIFGLTPNDLVTYVAVAAAFAVVAIVAAYVPALRATKVNPLVALRAD